MKTAEETLSTVTCNGCREITEERALQAMKEYAYEVAKESLRNASKHVDVDDFEYLHRYGKCFKNVLSEDNIPKEVKS